VSYLLERSQVIAASPEQVFAFFSDPGNLARITPEWLRFRIRERPAVLGAGSRLEYRIGWGFVTLTWVTRIVSWSPPVSFTDVEEKGPYKKWVHTHVFTEVGGGVRMEDRVEYALPLGALGRLVHALRVRRQLEEIFDFRRRAIDEIFSVSGDVAVPRGPRPSS
jgi:ligand-binding SRPBCC domain-containing protein